MQVSLQQGGGRGGKNEDIKIYIFFGHYLNSPSTPYILTKFMYISSVNRFDTAGAVPITYKILIA